MRGRKKSLWCDTIELDCFSGKKEAAPVCVCSVHVVCVSVRECLPVRQDVTVFEIAFVFFVW